MKKRKQDRAEGSSWDAFGDSYLKDLAENMEDALLMLTSDKGIIVANSAIRKLAGTGKKKPDLADLLEGLKKRVKIKGEKKEKPLALSRTIDKVIKTGRDFHFPKCSSEEGHFEVFVRPASGPSPKKRGVIIIVRDITRFEEIKKMKTDFISIASHQLRTPLTSIKLFMEILANEKDGELNEKQREYVRDARESTERMIALVNNLLNVSRLEENKLRIEPKPEDLRYFVKDVIHGVMQLANEKGVKVDFKYPEEESFQVAIDRTLLHQVVHNILTNAIKYSSIGRRGKIKIDLKKRKSDCLLSIKDNGIGISSEERKKIFEKFFRSDEAIKTHSEGTGLGLYVAKIIIESSGTDMWLKSQKGKGTTFYISIPFKGMDKKEGSRDLVN